MHAKKFFSPKEERDSRTPISYSDAIFVEDEKNSNAPKPARPLSIEELLEGGLVKAVMSDNCSTPNASSQREWQHGFVEISTDKTIFRFFQEGEKQKKFLLSAKKIGETDYYISQYFGYPQELDKSGMPTKGSPQRPTPSVPRVGGHRFCCSLHLNSTSRKFELWSKTCEKCDNELSKFSCGENLSGSERRQMLADIKHAERSICAGDTTMTADARWIRIDIPHVSTKLVRSGWCERFPRNAANKGMQLASNLPTWNERIQSLSLKFVEGRVRAASSKNFLISCPDPRAGKDKNGNPLLHDCMQFGKVKSGKFNLSYRFPVAAIQAFAVALSTYSWKKKAT